MEQWAKIIGLIEQKEIGRLIRYALQTDYFLTNKGLSYYLWDSFLDPYDRPIGIPTIIAEQELSQIENDLVRSLHHLKDIDPDKLGQHRERLNKMLCRVFENPFYKDADDNSKQLHYYQGYHDIASIIVIRFGFREGLMLIERLSRSHLRDFMAADINPTVSFSTFVIRLLDHFDAQVASKLRLMEMPPYFFLSWIMSWMSHDLKNYEMAARVMDCMVMLPPAAIGYLSVALIRRARGNILQYDGGYGGEEWGRLHSELKALPSTDAWSRTLIVEAMQMMEKLPPSRIISNLPELKGTSFDRDLPAHAFPLASAILLPVMLAILIAILYRYHSAD